MNLINSSKLYAGLLPTLLTAVMPSALQAQSVVQKRPNIIWISTEDFSPHLGCYGDKVAQTPHIDKLASQGVRFTNAFTTAAISAPCRAGIITGMYQTSIGCMHMRTTSYRRAMDDPMEFTAVPPHYVKAFTEYLRAAGYYCTNNYKTDYQFAKDPVPASIWDECSKTAHYKNRPDKSQPFFAVFNHIGTHESQNWDIEKVKTDPQSVMVPPYYPDTEIVRRNIAKSYDNTARLDSVVASLLAELEREGEADNTIVFFWGDHGDGLPRAKRFLYDSGLKIPLIIRWPGNIKPGTVNDQLVSSIDLGPTVLSMAGVKVPVHMQGRPILGQQAAEPRDYVYATRDRVDESYDMIRSVRSKDYLYIRNFYPNEPFHIWVPYLNKMPIMQEVMRLDAEGKLNAAQKAWMTDSRPPEELYDVKADSYQINNLAGDPKYKKVLTQMRTLQDEWALATNDMGRMNEPEMVEQMWPGGQQPVTDDPSFIVNAPEDRGSKKYQSGGTYSSPMTLAFYCSTHGTSIVYTTDTGSKPMWKLYSGAIRLPEGTTTVRMKAVRYGYKDSNEVAGTFEIK
ncbi:MAG TPA: sulfatase-like hydrolase/transferase [Prolixibacteraceae bacterium]|nr:sulfatase-like hydrolase/transferase [Prolixibacteraceae bacterium]